MTEDQLAEYIAANPQAGEEPPSEGGWFRLQYMPTAARALDLLLNDGTILESQTISNPMFLCEPRTFIGWRPAPCERVKAEETAKYTGRMSEADLTAYLASIDDQYDRRGWF